MALDMTTALTIRAKVDGTSQVDALGRSLGNTEKQATGLAGAFQRLGSVGKSVGGVLASIGVGALAKTFADAGVEADRTQKRVANLAGPLNETSSLMKFAAQAAETYGIGQTQATNAVADLYARLRPAGTSLDQIKTAFLGVNNAAAAMGLTADQTDNVMLQLSQALGSGKLQGDEFRSVMEQLPSIGQAVASVLGVDVAQLKALSSEGKITSDVLLQALNKLSQQKPPPPDAYKQFQAALANLQTEIGTKLLPALTPLVEFGSQLLNAFSQLPEPLQTVIVAVGGLAAAFVVLAPAISAIVTVGTALAGVFAGGSIFATLAGALGAVVPTITAVGGALSGLLPIIAAVFTGPVGWVALAVAAGAAIYAFRDQIGAAFQAIGQAIATAASAFKTVFIDPVIQLGQQVINFYAQTWIGIFNFIKQPFEQGWQWIQQNFITPLQSAFQQSVQYIQGAWAGMQQIISAPFTAALGVVKGALNSIMGAIEGGINGAVGAINALIAAANRVPGVNIPTVSPVKLPRFAEGGVVSGPTIAMVGEGGEPEYIVPQSKASAFAANWMAGVRGPAAIPRFAEGGVVVPSSASVSIQTGPVTQMNGTNYVTTQDLSRAVQAGVNQTLSLIAGDGSVRRQLGIA